MQLDFLSKNLIQRPVKIGHFDGNRVHAHVFKRHRGAIDYKRAYCLVERSKTSDAAQQDQLDRIGLVAGIARAHKVSQIGAHFDVLVLELVEPLWLRPEDFFGACFFLRRLEIQINCEQFLSLTGLDSDLQDIAAALRVLKLVKRECLHTIIECKSRVALGVFDCVAVAYSAPAGFDGERGYLVLLCRRSDLLRLIERD